MGRPGDPPQGLGPVYVPSEDTGALARVLRSYHGGVCLEIGFGSGAVLAALARGFETVVGTDVVSVAQAVESKDGSEAILADRATCFRDGIFDLVAFNPPYLPSAGIEDRAVDGGRGGLEVPLAFLEEALRVSKADAPIVLLLSSESDLEEFARRAGELGLSVAEKARKELFFETLFVYEVRKRRAPGAPRPGR